MLQHIGNVDPKVQAAQARGEDYVVQGPKITAIGWIPYFDSLTGTPFTAFRRQRALRAIMRSGNASPPDQIAGDSDIKRLEYFREFRSVSQIQMSVRFSTQGCYTAFIPNEQTMVGYTPVRVDIPGVKARFTWHMEGGTQFIPHEIEEAPDKSWIELRYTSAVRVGLVANIGSFVITRHWAPYAWNKITYRVFATGEVKVGFAGACIPSAAIYCDGRPMERYDMLLANEGQIESFLRAGGKQMAPVEVNIQTTSVRGTIVRP